MPAYVGQNSHVLHANVGQFGLENRSDRDVALPAQRLDLFTGDFGGLIETHGQRLPDRVVIDQGTRFLQHGTRRAQGLVAFQTDGQIGLTGRN